MNISEISIKRPVFPLMIAIALCIFGYTALTTMPLDLMPDIDFPIITIQTFYPGADADTVENDVSDKIEEAVSVVSGIKILKSTSYENVSILMIQFDTGLDINEKTQEVRDKISAIRLLLPSDIEEPVIGKFNINELPIVSIVISGPESIAKVTEFTEDIVKQRLQQITGVGSINRIGGRERRIRIWLDPIKLKAKNLAALEVAQAIASENIDVPAGTITQGTTDFVVKTKGRVTKVKDFENIIISYIMGAPIYLRDVARVQDGLEDETSISRLDGKSAVSLQVIKQAGGNSVAIVDEIIDIIPELLRIAPAGYEIQVGQNLTDFIKIAIDGALGDVQLGILFTVIVILLFLANSRMTIVTAIAIPTSLLAAIATITFFGYTLNMITIMALALTVGIVVDDTVVMVENIHRHLEMGKSRMKAAIDGAKEITFAIIATSLSLMAVFLPLSTMSGIAGEFFRPFGITVGVAVLWSTTISLILSPMLSSRIVTFTNGKDGKPKGLYARFSNAILSRLEKVYKAMLGFALKARFLIIFIAVLVFIGGIFVATQIKTEFEPIIDQSEFSVNIEAPQGTTLEKTTKISEEIENIIRESRWTQFVYATIGGGALSEAQKSSIYIKLIPTNERPGVSQDDIMRDFRVMLAKVNDKLPQDEQLIISVEEAAMISGMSQKPVQFSVRGPDFSVLDNLTRVIESEIRKHQGFIDIDRTYKVGKPEVMLKINREKAAELGVPISLVAMTIRKFIAGEEVTKFKDGAKEYEVIMQLGSDYRDSVNKLLNLHVRSTKGQLIQMSNIAKLERSDGMSEIHRFSRQREVLVMASLEGLVLGDAMAIIDDIMRTKVKLPSGYQASHEGMARNQMEAFSDILGALALSFLLVYIVLAIQFNSFVHPITILMTSPLAFVGGWLALYIFGHTMNIFSMVGLVLLVGIVTKNGILLIDFITKYRAKGLSKHSAILKAGPIRLRPIFMTAFSTIAAMLPLAMQLSDGSEMRAPMAFVIIGGLVTSTFLTLLVIPVVYSIFDDIANNRLFKAFLNLIIPNETGKIDDSKVHNRMLLEEFNALPKGTNDSEKSNVHQDSVSKKDTAPLKIMRNSEVLRKLDDAASKIENQPETDAYNLDFDAELLEVHQKQSKKKSSDISLELGNLPDLRVPEPKSEKKFETEKVEKDSEIMQKSEQFTDEPKQIPASEFSKIFNELMAENPDKFAELVNKVQDLQQDASAEELTREPKKSDETTDVRQKHDEVQSSEKTTQQADLDLLDDPVITLKIQEEPKIEEVSTDSDEKELSESGDKKSVQKPAMFSEPKPQVDKDEQKTDADLSSDEQSKDSQAVIFPPPKPKKQNNQDDDHDKK